MKPQIVFATALAIAALSFAPQTVFAKKKQVQNSSSQVAKKKARKANTKKGTTRYNFRARTYYPWYEGYDGLESYYMQFDRNFGY